MDLFTTIILSLAGGIVPATIWLFFWLKEDAKHPEPGILITLTFVYGIISVLVALALQFLVNMLFLHGRDIEIVFFNSFPTAITVLILWSATEEIVKYVAAYNGGLKRKSNDEPVDAMIYMITAALGFSAMENVFYLFFPILSGDTTVALITGNMRFIGSTLLHIATSAIIGAFIAFSYFKNKEVKKIYLFAGFFFAIVLHTLFNSFIIKAENFTLIGFAGVWTAIVLIIILFEKVKKIYSPEIYKD